MSQLQTALENRLRPWRKTFSERSMKAYNDQQNHWLNMPEFNQSKIKPYAQIIIRVNSKSDLDELSKRLEQPLTSKTKSAWFPFKSHWGLEKKIWTTENES
jgi:hypothetical protein